MDGNTGMNIFGLIMVLFMAVASVAVSFYVFVFFSHPQDKDFMGVWVVRGLIVLGIAISTMILLLIPIDMFSAHEQ